MSDLIFSTKPPEPREDRYDLVSPEPGLKVNGIAVNDSVTGVLIHFVDGYSTPCIGESCGCYGCRLGWRPKWKGYLPICFPYNGRVQIAEITEGAFSRCKEVHEIDSLRGLEITLRRVGKIKHGRVEMDVGTRRVPDESLPKRIDCERFLRFLWGRQLTYAAKVLKHKKPF